MTNTGLAVSVEDGIAILRLDRPQRGNAVDAGVQRALKQAWAQVREDRSIRAAVITGSGERHFCTGGDVAGLDTQGDTALVNAPFQEAVAFSPLQNRVFKPVICAVNGLACGELAAISRAISSALGSTSADVRTSSSTMPSS
jgi:E-phenylitaconyl-CoA hydratase